MDFDEVQKACRLALGMVETQHGPYGGLYVIRTGSVIEILKHDDPDKLRPDDDVLAHVQPGIVAAMGRARFWLKADGTIDWEVGIGEIR